MIGLETVRQLLALVVRVDDHFTREPLREAVAVTLDSLEPPLRGPAGRGERQLDGSYRFLAPVRAGMRQIRVAGPSMFTWTPTTSVSLPLADPRAVVVIEAWPTANARLPAGTLAIRGRLLSAPPVAAGQEVRIEAAFVAPRGRRTRCDADGEFLFVVAGPIQLSAARMAPLVVSVPGRTIASIDIHDGDVVATTPSANVAVPPGRETRALIHLI